jgi:ssDNA thymidine ADP-ribosyltransferase, DarT
MYIDIEQQVVSRNITRLCHFTPSRNLPNILKNKIGILSTKDLKDDERAIYNPTDLQRLDGHTSYVCCSIEYPNPWYFDKAREREFIFKDWVVVFINPKYLWNTSTLFCPRNAASSSGRNIILPSGFDKLFAQQQGNQCRSATHLSCCPTDNQAEVLIQDKIHLSDISGVAVVSEDQARNEIARLNMLNISLEGIRFFIAPDLFQKKILSSKISSGVRIEETLYQAS